MILSLALMVSQMAAPMASIYLLCRTRDMGY